MTREEAILCLKGMKNYARDTFTEQTDWQTSLDMAIEALEQEPTEFEELEFVQKHKNIPVTLKMRDATPEERESVDKYVKSISKPTGVDFWDLEQQPYKAESEEV